jgi:predicted metal-dependent enzyme (double-stranded beta helix superfamily)
MGRAVSIHVYGANIGAVRRHRLDDAGALLDFVSGYDSELLPNLWDRSAAVRSGA